MNFLESLMTNLFLLYLLFLLLFCILVELVVGCLAVGGSVIPNATRGVPK